MNKIQQINNINKKRLDLLMKQDSLSIVDSFDVNDLSNEKGLFKMSKSKSETKEINAVELTNDDVELIESHLLEKIDSLIKVNSELMSRLEIAMSSKDGRKSQVLALLEEHEAISILSIANNLNISTKNVSSQLTYLRSDGHKIFTDHNGLKVLMK